MVKILECIMSLRVPTIKEVHVQYVCVFCLCVFIAHWIISCPCKQREVLSLILVSFFFGVGKIISLAIKNTPSQKKTDISFLIETDCLYTLHILKVSVCPAFTGGIILDFISMGIIRPLKCPWSSFLQDRNTKNKYVFICHSNLAIKALENNTGLKARNFSLSEMCSGFSTKMEGSGQERCGV